MGRMNDWAIEHEEVIGHALEVGIESWHELWSFALEHMLAVNEEHLRKLWDERQENV